MQQIKKLMLEKRRETPHENSGRDLLSPKPSYPSLVEMTTPHSYE
ncbi:unnamed protein product [Spirodela intermedia]|uniref:Uncharacterized protein n=1 Tax=Spirodela intermedia TaxID=51605 RepID=A0A7I8KF63_SPIIN|nr:unnamed protein product [Spirodela intermedia]